MRAAALLLAVAVAGCGGGPPAKMIYFFQPLDPVATGSGTVFKHTGKDWRLEVDIAPNSVRYLLHNNGVSPLKLYWDEPNQNRSPVETVAGGHELPYRADAIAPPGGEAWGQHVFPQPILPEHSGDWPDPVGTIVCLPVLLAGEETETRLLFRYRVTEAHELK